jgi:hypothetical protein
MSKKEAQGQEPSLEMQLLMEKVKNLESKVTKPQTSDEEYQERLAKYEVSKGQREELKAQIESRKMEIWQQNPKMRQDEVILMEAWERRAKSIEATNPDFAKQLKHQMKLKVKEVNEAYDR